MIPHAVLICISLITGNAEHLFICLSTIFISFWGNGGELSVPFPYFLSHFLSSSLYFKDLKNDLRDINSAAIIHVLPVCQLSFDFVVLAT